ncbi:MAG: YbjN domain-containing protein [Hyphomonadaceae bacterium]|nr:YbjN domain-containing protein [Hyphomonadaceae bacterium]
MDRPLATVDDPLFADGDILDTVEAVLVSENRPHERLDNEVHFATPTPWCNLHGLVAVQDDMPAFTVQFVFELKAPVQRRADINALVALLNEACWLGHFEPGSEDVPISWRFTAPLIGRNDPEPAEMAAIIAAGVDVCSKFYPAFNFLLWAGKSPQEAAEAAMFETLGQA